MTAPANGMSKTSRAMRFSLWTGFLMLVIKMGAYLLTGSAAILGDAAESVVHVGAVMFAAFSVWLAEKPADEENHRYGHTRSPSFPPAPKALSSFSPPFSSYITNRCACRGSPARSRPTWTKACCSP